ncbi:MAG: hypothetical protein RID91_12705 [Azospirillaceae bacterium]
MVGRPRKLDSGDQARVLALRDRDGKTLREIAALYGVGIATVSRVYSQAKRQHEAGVLRLPEPEPETGPDEGVSEEPAQAPTDPPTATAGPRAADPDAGAGVPASPAPARGGEKRPVLSLAGRGEAPSADPGRTLRPDPAPDPANALESEVSAAIDAYRRWQATPDEARYAEVDESLARVRRALAAIEIELWTAT